MRTSGKKIPLEPKHNVSFATSVYEKDWRQVLLTGHLQEIIDSSHYQFAYRLLIVNKVISTELLEAVDAHL